MLAPSAKAMTELVSFGLAWSGDKEIPLAIAFQYLNSELPYRVWAHPIYTLLDWLIQGLILGLMKG